VKVYVDCGKFLRIFHASTYGENFGQKIVAVTSIMSEEIILAQG